MTFTHKEKLINEAHSTDASNPLHCGSQWAIQTHHATVEVLVHLAEGVRRRLSLAGDDDADVGDGQGVLGLDVRSTAEVDEDAL